MRLSRKHMETLLRNLINKIKYIYQYKANSWIHFCCLSLYHNESVKEQVYRKGRLMVIL